MLSTGHSSSLIAVRIVRKMDSIVPGHGNRREPWRRDILGALYDRQAGTFSSVSVVRRISNITLEGAEAFRKYFLSSG